MVREAGVVGIAVVGDLEGRAHRGHRARGQFGRAAPARRIDVGTDLHGDLELDDQSAVDRGADPGRATHQLALVQPPRHRRGQPHHLLHGRIGERDLPAGHRAADPGLERHEGVLGGIGGCEVSGRETGRKGLEGPAFRVLCGQPAGRLA